MTDHCSVKSHLSPRKILFLHTVVFILYGLYFFIIYQRRLRQLKRSKVRKMVNYILILMVLSMLVFLIALAIPDRDGPHVKTHAEIVQSLFLYTIGVLATDLMNLLFYLFLFKINQVDIELDGLTLEPEKIL